MHFLISIGLCGHVMASAVKCLMRSEGILYGRNRYSIYVMFLQTVRALSPHHACKLVTLEGLFVLPCRRL